ncbi:AmiS/UreI family transporter [Halomarina pelagica]|uniref:AmiS/UreI family transporter n=1 Tax=Halomarina pelagica TaxID=2961599 RepID=UPI0020C2D805|nr:AmiS/UreI family transporter [Halomarina sp. BND7]
MSLYTELGMGLVFVGAVLVVNGLWLLGRGSDRDTAVLNFLVGGLTLFIALWWAFGGEASPGTAFNAAATLLFSFTYLWVGVNAYRRADDQRSLGWYCILVTVVAVPTGYLVWVGGDVGLALLWWIWAILWATFWLLLALRRTDYTAPVAWYTIAVGIVTGAAGYLMAAGFWPWAPA